MKVLCGLVVFTYCLSVIHSACVGQSVREVSDTELFESSSGSVAHLVCQFESKATGQIVSEQGTAFVLNSSGHLLTADHVVTENRRSICANGCRRACAVTLRARVGIQIPADVYAENAEADTALLKVAAVPAGINFTGVELGNPWSIKTGSPVRAMGFPLNLNLTIKAGQISSLDGPNSQWLTNLALNNGDSGGPVFNKAGKVVGLVAGGLQEINGIFTVSPLHLSAALLPIAGRSIPNEEDPGPPRPRLSCTDLVTSEAIVPNVSLQLEDTYTSMNIDGRQWKRFVATFRVNLRPPVSECVSFIEYDVKYQGFVPHRIHEPPYEWRYTDAYGCVDTPFYIRVGLKDSGAIRTYNYENFCADWSQARSR